MYNEDVSIDFSANVAPFSASLTQAIKQLESFGASSDGAVSKVGLLNTAALGLTKTMGKFLDLNKTSTAAAAAYQQKLAGLATVTTLNEKQFKGLSDVALKFGREFPIGLDKSINLVKTLQTSGVTTTKSIKELGSAFVKIQAATGEFGGQFVADMLSVNRSFGSSMSSVSKFGDSLVSVTNKFGASAGSVIGFTKSLAPFASAMGINQTSTIGLSTAFSRLGEDGTRSANALNKVMLDLTKSVKTGSPEIRQYAAIMNMTTESLTELVNSDPTEVIIRFTEAINKQGPRAMNTLNQLGIDGIQSFKSLQALGKSTDLRDILQTSREAYGSGSAKKGAEKALGGVNDQMNRLGESMSQTIAVAGTPFLELIASLLKGMNAVAEAVNKVTTMISNAAKAMAPLLAAVNVLKGAFQAIAAIQFARYLKNSFQNNTEMGRSLTKGKVDASYDIVQPGGNAMYRLGAALEDNKPGIMKQPFRETLSNAYQGIKGAGAFGIAGYMNMNANFLRSDPSEAAASQLNSRNFTANFKAAKAGETLTSSSERAGIEERNANRAKLSLPPLPGTKSGQEPANNFEATIKALKQFGSDLQDSGKAAKDASNMQVSAGGELRSAFKGLAVMTFKATGEIVKLGVSALASAAAGAIKNFAVEAAFSAVIGTAMSIKGDLDKSKAMYTEARETDLGTTYNEFAEKAGLATVSINQLSVAARDAARSLIMNNKTLDQANQLTQEEIDASKNPNYESAKDFGRGKSIEDLTNAVLNLQGNSPDAQARAQLLMDITDQYGSTAAIEVSRNLALQTGNGSTEEKATTQDVYSAGLADYKNNKRKTWYGANVQTEASQDSFNSLESNLAQNIQNISSIYGQKAGSAASVIESQKLLNAAKATGDSGQFKTAVDIVSDQLGVKLNTNMNDFATLTAALKNTSDISGNKEEKALELANRKNVLDSISGVDVSSANYVKLYNQNNKPQNVKNMEEADLAFKKINETATGLTDVFFEATQISLKNNANLDEISQSGKRSDIYGNLTATQKASVDLANKPNDPVALNTKALQALEESLKQNGGDLTAAMKQLALASEASAEGTTEKNIAVAAYGRAQQEQAISDTGLSFTTRAKRDIEAGNAALLQGPGYDKAEQERNAQKIAARDQVFTTMFQMAKQFAEASRDLDIQMAYQQEDYQTSVLRSNRDFNRQMKYQQEDYDKNVKRANENRKTQLQRQAEDYSKTAYNPFQRVGAVRTTDAAGLVGNLRNQNAIMTQQRDNLVKLKKLGLSQDAIDTMDLFNPAMAQQVARLAMDYAANTQLVTQTNAEVATRLDLAKEATTNPMNQSFARSQADFDKSMAQGLEDYTTASTRAVAIQKQNLADMLANLNTTRTRAFESLARFGSEVEITADNASDVMQGIFDKMPKAAKDKISEALKFVQKELKNFKPATVKVTTALNTPTDFTDAQIRGASEMAAEAGIRIANQAKVTAVAGATGKDAKGNFAWYFQHKGEKVPSWHVFNSSYAGSQTQRVNNALVNGMERPEAQPHAWWTIAKPGTKILNSQGDAYTFAQGGMVRGPGSGKSDSINARLSNGEYVVQADAVRKYGQSFLDNVNAQKLAHASYVHGSDSKMSSMQGYASNITNNTSTQFDQSTQINGPITVQSTDPKQFMRQMQARQRFARLTQPAGR